MTEVRARSTSAHGGGPPAAHSGHPGIADIAAAAGYADHSHLVRDFRSLAGCTPSQLVAEWWQA